MASSKERVVVAMSGGVDSSVAAALLLQAGYDAVGVTLQLRHCHSAARESVDAHEPVDAGEWNDQVAGRACCGADGIVEARAVAGLLGMPHFVLDCHREFEQQVLRPSWEEYSRGRTPNPCVLCNERIKFGLLLDFARTLGAQKIATGHYARVATRDPAEVLLLKGKDSRKDQSYFLFSLSAPQLAATVLPVGELTKVQVREHARELGLSNADRTESQDACLVSGDVGFSEILRQRFNGVAKPGAFVDTQGRTLGRHEGIHLFTLGQRRQLGLALGRPAWVQAIDPESARVVLSNDRHDLLSTGLTASGVLWNGPAPASGSIPCQAQVRYRQQPIAARIELDGKGGARVFFAKPVSAVTPGQAVVFYDRDRVLGGGWIERPLQDQR